jgi:class 3 adenylate cyclase
VLFADLVGFTSISEQHDPEEVRDLLSRYFDLAREVIEGYGGSVEKFIGDAVMALWGAPVAREDDPERAVRAALDLVARVRELSLGGERLAIRAGVLSGEAAVTPGRIGEGMVAGDVVNTASRLQSVAPANVVLVGESTQQATKASIAYERATDQILKGKELPVPAWRALRVVARVGGEGREEGLEPPFVGRDEEFRLLTEQLHAAERESKLRVVAVTGQAGLGKSRLVWELEKYLDGLAADRVYYWHQGRSPSYGEGVTYWALGEMVRLRARIAEGEDAASTREKLAATLADFVPDADERRRIEPALLALLGIENADWAQREQLFSAWRTFFERVADRGPTVLVFEELQWADDGLLDFIEHLLDWSRDKPILLLTLARPEILERRPNFGLGRHAFVAIHLDPLAAPPMAQLLRGLVPALSGDDLQRIVDRAEGVPLYAVETIRSLVDSGHLVRREDEYEPVGTLPVLDIPPTLRALIASRLDALDPADRTLVQAASVIGAAFAPASVAAVSGRPADEIAAGLRRLVGKELVALETDPRSPERGQYRFTQGLVREVAYAGLGRSERRVRHLAAARYLDTLDEGELAGVLAMHYVEAYRAAPEGDEASAIAGQARVALKAAAERARQLHSPAQAVTYYEQAIAVTFDEVDQNELKLRAAEAALTVGDGAKAERLAREAVAWNAARGDLLGEGQAASVLAAILLQLSKIDDAKALLIDVASRLPSEPSAVAVKLRGELARVHLFSDQPESALREIELALSAAERLFLDRKTTTDLIITKAWALVVSERYREGTALILGAMSVADDSSDLDGAWRARFNLSGMAITDDPHMALRVGRKGFASGLETGLTLYAASMAGNISAALMILGRFDEVMSLEADTPRVPDNPLAITIQNDAAIVFGFRGDASGVESRRAVIEQTFAGSTSQQDLGTRLYLDAMLAFGAGRMTEARDLAHQARDSYFGGSVGQVAVTALQISLLLGDAEGVRADSRWISDHRAFGDWLSRWGDIGEAGVAALEGRYADAGSAFRSLVEELRSADLKLDLAMTQLLRWTLMPEDDESTAALDDARALFSEMRVEEWVKHLMSTAAQTHAATVSSEAAAEDAPVPTRR